METVFSAQYIYNSKNEVNVADCTDQHFGGGCSKTVTEIESFTDCEHGRRSEIAGFGPKVETIEIQNSKSND